MGTTGDRIAKDRKGGGNYGRPDSKSQKRGWELRMTGQQKTEKGAGTTRDRTTNVMQKRGQELLESGHEKWARGRNHLEKGGNGKRE